MIPYGKQSIDDSDVKAVLDVLKSDWLTQGPKVQEFEEAIAKYCGTKYAVVFSNGTAALHGSYFSAGLKHGDEFITSPLTFAATANAGLYLGAKPVFADINEYGNLDPHETEKKINSKTKLISVVDYTGNPANLSAFKKLAKKYKLILIEDACQALGAEYKGEKIGSISDMTVFSFHPVKSITTGEGGAVTTNSKEFYEKLLLFRNHGITKDPKKFKKPSSMGWYMEMQALGYNYRLTDIQSALGLSQLKRIDDFLRARRIIAKKYTEAFSGLVDLVELPKESEGALSAWHIYVVHLRGRLKNKRGEIFETLRKQGIGVQVHHIPVYYHPYYEELGYKKGLYPKAEAFYDTCFSLPIFPSLNNDDQEEVIRVFKNIVQSDSI